MSNQFTDLVRYMKQRYGTANPFVICERLNIDVQWRPFLDEPLGETTHFRGRPIILLADFLRHSNQRYFVVAHELGHVLEHEDLEALYTSSGHWHGQFEHQADAFAVALITQLFHEENESLPDNYGQLIHEYGFPELRE